MPPPAPDRPPPRQPAAPWRPHRCKKRRSPPAPGSPPVVPSPAHTRPWRWRPQTAAAPAGKNAPPRQRPPQPAAHPPPSSPAGRPGIHIPAKTPLRHRFLRPGPPADTASAGGGFPPACPLPAEADNPSPCLKQTRCLCTPPSRPRLLFVRWGYYRAGSGEKRS